LCSFCCIVSGFNLNQYLDILSLPGEFYNKGNEEILRYLKSNSPQSQEIYRMRIVLVGPGSAGKTTLVHRMQTGEFRAGQFSMTSGISMKEWKLPNTVADTPPLHLVLWDFGGQEVYMNSHPILFSDRALYLLVWNPCSGTTLQTLEEYIRNIRSRSPSGPIMLVTTHSEEMGALNMREIQHSLIELQRHTWLKYFALDSRTGHGIEELKRSIIGFVTGEAVQYSRVLVPDWYLQLQSRLRQERENHFSIDQRNFLSICSAVLPQHSTELKGESDCSIAGERMRVILELFHHWGVICVLPNPTSGCQFGGDIVLDPQKLANVFKCVITSHTDTTDNKQLFEEGILVHDRVGFVWPEEQFDPRFYPEFLHLFHDCELAYELFDETGASSGRSLVPYLLAESPPLSEEELRARLLSAWDSTSPSIAELKSKNQIISRGFVKIAFDSLLSNFFPKLMVRLHHLSSNSDCSRRRFVIRVPERVQATNGLGLEVGWSVCCVVEDKSSSSLIVYPGGCSYDATTIALQAIRRLMEGSFSGMCVKHLTYSIDEEVFSREKILRLLRQNQLATVPLDDGSDLKISLAFLSCLFVELDLKQTDLITDISSLHLSSSDLLATSTLASLVSQLSRSSSNPTALDLFNLGNSLVKTIPIFRHSGLKLSPHPSILWVCGQSSSAVHVVGVSPSVVPSQSWEIVWDSVISFPISSSQLSSESVLPLNELLLSSLRCLLPDHRLPDWVVSGSPIEWVGAVDCHSQEGLLASQGSQYFGPSRDILGEVVYYSQAMLTRQRAQGGLSVEDLEKVVKEQVGPISEAVKKLREVLEEIRQELLTIHNHEALWVLQHLWKMEWESLESLILSSSSSSSTSGPYATEEQLAKEIKKEMRLMENSFTGKILELDLDEKFADRLSSEMRKLREVLLSANEDQLNDLLEALKATM
jgi:GTPase SAR1 family protein